MPQDDPVNAVPLEEVALSVEELARALYQPMARELAFNPRARTGA